MQPLFHPTRPYQFTIDRPAQDREQIVLPAHLRAELPGLLDNPSVGGPLPDAVILFANTGVIPQDSEECAAAFHACLKCGLVDQAIHIGESGRIAFLRIGPLAYRRDIIEAFARGGGLDELYLESTDNSNQGHDALCEQLANGHVQPTLLEIDDCEFTREAFVDLLQCVLQSGRLERLSLTHPGFEDWVAAVAASAVQTRALTELRIDAPNATADDVVSGIDILASSNLPLLRKIEIRCDADVPLEHDIYTHLEFLLNTRHGRLTELALVGRAFDNPSHGFAQAVNSESCTLQHLRLSHLDIDLLSGFEDPAIADRNELARCLLRSHPERRSLTLDARLVAGLGPREISDSIARTNLEKLVIEPLAVGTPNFLAIREGLATNHTLVSLGDDWYLRPSDMTADKFGNQLFVQGLLARNLRYRQLALAGTRVMAPELRPHYTGLQELQARLPNEVIEMIFDHLGNDRDPAFAASLMNSSLSMRSAFIERRVVDWLAEDTLGGDFKATRMLQDLAEAGPNAYDPHPKSAPPVPLRMHDVHAIHDAAASRWIANPEESSKPQVSERHAVTQATVKGFLLKLLDRTGQPRQGLPDATAVDPSEVDGSPRRQETGEPAAKVRKLND